MKKNKTSFARKISVDNIYIVILLITIFLSFIYIGTPTGTNLNLIQGTMFFLTIPYILIKRIKSKNIKLIDNFLDITVVTLCITTALPDIFNTSVSTYESMLIFFRYLAVFNTYILVKNIVIDKEKLIFVFENILIVGMVFLCILGFENLITNVLTIKFHEFFGIFENTNKLGRMLSIIGYTNTFGILASSIMFLLITRYLSTEKLLLKALYIFGSFIILTAIILTYSIGAIGIFGIMFIIYFVLLKTKERRFKTFNLMFINGVLGIIYIFVFKKLLQIESIVFPWIVLFLLGTINVTLVLLFNQLSLKIKNLNTKNIIIIIVSIIVFVVLFIFIGFNIPVELNIFAKNTSDKPYAIHLHDVDPLNEYTFDFDIDSKTINQNDNTYKIEIIERNIYYDTIKTNVIVFGNFSGIKSEKIKFGEDTTSIKINFVSTNKNEQNGLSVKTLKINDKQYNLKYSYLPIELVEKVQLLLFHPNESKSLFERIEFMRTALELSKDNHYLGIGGNCWQFEYHNAQKYLYYSTQTHSYPFAIILEFGILGIISYILMQGYLIYYFIKNRKNLNLEELTIFLALFAISLHSIFDFNMSYYIVLMITYMYLAVISSKINNNTIQNIIQKKYIFWPFIAILLCINTYAGIYQIYQPSVINKDGIIQVKDAKEVQEYLDMFPFDSNVRKTYILDMAGYIEKTKNINELVHHFLIYIKDKDEYDPLIQNSKIMVAVFDNKNELDENLEKNFFIKDYEYIENMLSSNSLHIDVKAVAIVDLANFIKLMNNNYLILDDYEKEIYEKSKLLYSQNYDKIYKQINTNKSLRLDEIKKVKLTSYIQNYGVNIDEVI